MTKRRKLDLVEVGVAAETCSTIIVTAVQPATPTSAGDEDAPVEQRPLEWAAHRASEVAAPLSPAAAPVTSHSDAVTDSGVVQAPVAMGRAAETVELVSQPSGGGSELSPTAQAAAAPHPGGTAADGSVDEGAVVDELLLTGGSVCIVCGADIAALTLLQREVHRNECLDRQNDDWATQRGTAERPPIDDGDADADDAVGDGNDDAVEVVGGGGGGIGRQRAAVPPPGDVIDLSVEHVDDDSDTTPPSAAAAAASVQRAAAMASVLDGRRSRSVDAFAALRRGAAQKWSPSADAGARDVSAVVTPPVAPSPSNAFATMMQAAREQSLTVPSTTAAAAGPASKRRAARNGQPPSGYCPFYKRIPGTPFIVDGFNFACPQLSRHYILTHFHRLEEATGIHYL